jgi:hypothetical protein
MGTPQLNLRPVMRFLENAEAQVSLRMRNCDDCGIEVVLEVVGVAFHADENPASCLELTDHVTRTLHGLSLQPLGCMSSTLPDHLPREQAQKVIG